MVQCTDQISPHFQILQENHKTNLQHFKMKMFEKNSKTIL